MKYVDVCRRGPMNRFSWQISNKSDPMRKYRRRNDRVECLWARRWRRPGRNESSILRYWWRWECFIGQSERILVLKRTRQLKCSRKSLNDKPVVRSPRYRHFHQSSADLEPRSDNWRDRNVQVEIPSHVRVDVRRLWTYSSNCTNSCL